MNSKIEIEGYAALFGAADLACDVIKAGAFRDSLIRSRGDVPMFVHHEPRLHAGRWTETREDKRGLYVRGEIDPGLPGAAQARRLIERGGDGLSIGFITRVAEGRAGGGRLLIEIDLLEISIVEQPMQPLARLNLARALARAA